MPDNTLNQDTVNILGTEVACTALEGAVKSIYGWIHNRGQRYVTVTGAHGIIEAFRSSDIKEAHANAAASMPDGMPLSWIGWMKGHKDMNRVYGPDLMFSTLQMCANKGFSSFFYGGAEDVAESLAQKMKQRFPALKIAGTYTPPFRPLTEKEEHEIITKINATSPDIIWIGLSTPKQELLMNRWKGRIKAPLMIGVGAAFDFLSGRKKQAPRWMQRAGLEWLFRLSREPKRLWRRYLLIVPTFIALAAMQIIGVIDFGSKILKTSDSKRPAIAPRLILLGLLALTTAGLTILPQPVAVEKMPISTTLPDSIGEWHGTDLYFCQNEQCMKTSYTNASDSLWCPYCSSAMKQSWSLAESRQLPPGTILSKKLYAAEDNRRCLVTIVVSGYERVGIHRPQMCLPGQGFKILREESLTLSLQEECDFELRRLHLSPPQSNGPELDYYYWFTDGTYETESHFRRILMSSYDRIFRGRISRWAYISVAPFTSNTRFSLSDLEPFVRSLKNNNKPEQHEHH